MIQQHATEGPRETRAVARLPGVDIAIVHTEAHEGGGESVTIMLQQTAARPISAFDPVGLWLQMTQAAWAPWLAVTASLWGIPRILDRK